MTNFHVFCILPPSWWPFKIASVLLLLVVSFVAYMNYVVFSFYFLIFGFGMLFYFVFRWTLDLTKEAANGHTAKVEESIRFGMILFIFSEVMFFFTFFWSFFYYSLSPAIILGGIWPPVGLTQCVISAWGVPLLILCYYYHPALL